MLFFLKQKNAKLTCSICIAHPVLTGRYFCVARVFMFRGSNLDPKRKTNVRQQKRPINDSAGNHRAIPAFQFGLSNGRNNLNSSNLEILRLEIKSSNSDSGLEFQVKNFKRFWVFNQRNWCLTFTSDIHLIMSA